MCILCKGVRLNMPTQTIERDGGNRVVIAARALVILVQTFGGALIQKYGANSAIGLLIAAILNLGALLPSADAQVFEYGGNNEAIELDPNAIPGIDEGAPAPPDEPE